MSNDAAKVFLGFILVGFVLMGFGVLEYDRNGYGGRFFPFRLAKEKPSKPTIPTGNNSSSSNNILTHNNNNSKKDYTCTNCNGKGTQTCTICNGKGTQTCIICRGSGINPINQPIINYYTGSITYAQINCLSCNGSGKSNCICYGTGTTSCYLCSGSGTYIPHSNSGNYNSSGGNYNNSSGNYSNSSSGSSNLTRQCTSCRGTGKGMDQKTYSPNYTGSSNNKYCSTCGYIGPAHTHHTPICRVCNGRGTV